MVHRAQSISVPAACVLCKSCQRVNKKSRIAISKGEDKPSPLLWTSFAGCFVVDIVGAMACPRPAAGGLITRFIVDFFSQIAFSVVHRLRQYHHLALPVHYCSRHAQKAWYERCEWRPGRALHSWPRWH